MDYDLRGAVSVPFRGSEVETNKVIEITRSQSIKFPSPFGVVRSKQELPNASDAIVDVVSVPFRGSEVETITEFMRLQKESLLASFRPLSG